MAAEMEPKSLSQYHHYIPQFLLRRFALAPSGGRRNGKKRNRKPKGNELLNVVSLVKDPPEISTVLLRRTFGQPDMYKDDLKSSEKDQMRIERKLGDIERAASHIIARVVDAHNSGKDDISLSRNDKDVLRKFLFVMKYRSPDFFRKYNHQTAEEYHSDDRDEFLEYMRVKNIKRPLDVWFDNLIKIIDMPMDPAGNWTNELFNSIYPVEALWMSTNFQSMYLAFVTPSDLSEEFILAENAFDLQEGPTSYLVHSLTGEQKVTAYTEFHVLSVISPHLAMILRHNSLPEPLEDKDKKVRDGKKKILAMQAQKHTEPDRATSSLQDLPVAKARNSCTVVKNGRAVLDNGADGVPSATDMFNFVFFRLESGHLQSINAIMLDQAHKISTIVFKSETALRKALEFYLSSRVYTNIERGRKFINIRQNEPSLLLFRKLEHIAHSLGLDVKAKYYVDPPMDADGPTPFDKIIAEVLKTVKPILLNSPLALPMKVLVEVPTKSNLNPLAIYALDLILEGDGQPSYPELVFKVVQLEDPANLDQHTKELCKVELETWKLGWKLLVLQFLEEPGADLNHEIELMRGHLAGLGIKPPSKVISALARPSPQHASQVGQEKSNSQLYDQLYGQLYGQPQKNKGVKAATKASGFSRQGLSKAFDNIGRDIQEQDASLLVISKPPKLETSSRQTNREKNVAYQKILSPQLSEKKYVGDISPIKPVGVRDVDASSNILPPQLSEKKHVGDISPIGPVGVCEVDAPSNILPPQLSEKKYVGDTSPIGPVGVRNIDAPSNILPPQLSEKKYVENTSPIGPVGVRDVDAPSNILPPQPSEKKYVGDTSPIRPVGVREVDALSNNLPPQDAVLFAALFAVLFGILVWYYFSW